MINNQRASFIQLNFLLYPLKENSYLSTLSTGNGSTGLSTGSGPLEHIGALVIDWSFFLSFTISKTVMVF